jgi:hypothetical protein
MIEPKIYKDEYAQDDENTPIPFEYRTKEFFVGDPTLNKILRETRTLVEINELAELYQYIYINGEQKDEKLIDKNNLT